MIVTLTPNTGIDYSMVVPGLQLNATVRSSAQAWGMGGKATDVAWVLGKLGVPVLALGFAAGPNGERMERMLRERGVETDFVEAGGETRLNIVMVCSDGSGQSTFTSSSLNVSNDQVTELEERFRAALSKASCVVLGGSLPPGAPLGLHAQAIRQARSRGLPIIFDASGVALRAGIEARPTIVKPNLEEFAELLGFRPNSPAETMEAARQLQARYGSDVIVTLGRAGALAVMGTQAYHIPPLTLPVASSAGAGDGVLAGLALAFSRGESPEAGLRHGFALAGAILQTLGTADFRLPDYQDLLSKIELNPVRDSIDFDWDLIPEPGRS